MAVLHSSQLLIPQPHWPKAFIDACVLKWYSPALTELFRRPESFAIQLRYGCELALVQHRHFRLTSPAPLNQHLMPRHCSWEWEETACDQFIPELSSALPNAGWRPPGTLRKSKTGLETVCRSTARNPPNQYADHLIISSTFVPSGIVAICL